MTASNEAITRMPPPTPKPVDCSDPVSFARNFLGFDPWEKQAEIMQAIAVNRRVAVRSGHKIGKSRLAVSIAEWFWATKKNARVILTAPTGRQVREILWREITSLHQHAVIPLGGQLLRTPSGGLTADDGRQIIGFSTDTGEAFSGVSGENVLYIVDEASGYDELIFEAIEGNRAGGASLLLLGNPTQTSGTFYRAFNEERNRWVTFHVSSLEAVEWQERNHRIPGLATREWIEEKKRDGWEGTSLWDVRVAGDFPREGSNTIIGLALIEAAQKRWRDAKPDMAQRLRIGVDVARFGDDEAVIQSVRNDYAFPAVAFHALDGPQLASKVLDEARLRRRDILEKPVVNIDVIGVGVGPYDVLKHEKEIECHPINVGESSTVLTPAGEPGFSLLRDQLWFGCRDWFKADGCLPVDGKMEADLVAAKYGYDARGKIKVEAKNDMKKRLGRSPDRGDALCLAVYEDRSGVGKYLAGMRRLASSA